MTNIMQRVRAFFGDDSGAVTVDWVVLTAIIIGFATPIGVNYVAQLTGATGLISSNIAAQSSLLP